MGHTSGPSITPKRLNSNRHDVHYCTQQLSHERHMSRITTPGLTARRGLTPTSYTFASAGFGYDIMSHHIVTGTDSEDVHREVNSADRRKERKRRGKKKQVRARCRVSVKAESGQHKGSDSSSNFGSCIFIHRHRARAHDTVYQRGINVLYPRGVQYRRQTE